MDYLEKLKDPRWQKKRLEILNEWTFKCGSCRRVDKELHVHHRKYQTNRELWEYDNKDFLVLCMDCHKEMHKFLEWVQLVFVTSTPDQRAEIKHECLKILGLLDG